MAIRVLLVALALFCGGACSLRAANTATLVASTAALACDWGQTRGVASAASEGRWTLDYWEENPVMGPRPSTGDVDLYFAAAAALNAAAWVAIPRRYRWIIPSVVLAVQTAAIVQNAHRIEDSEVAGDMHAWACGA